MFYVFQSGNQHGYLPPSVVSLQGNIFGGLDDSLLARAEALAAADISKGPSPPLVKPDSIYGHTDMSPHGQPPASRGQMPIHGFGPGDSMLDQISAGMGMPLTSMAGPDHSVGGGLSSHGHTHAQSMYSPVYTHAGMNGMHPQHGLQAGHHPHAMPGHHPEGDCDPRELEAFAEHFKQRRIKLGVTQADVGVALGKLKLPGVGSLSQSTICRFESLTLSHNNMIALKPVLQAWLEEAERQMKENQKSPDIFNSAADKKRKRTSIAAPEKRSLEAYFAVQPRPSGEKIAQIAEKLDLKKNVVRVWFCNQRQKQKRMKFSAVTGMGSAHGQNTH